MRTKINDDLKAAMKSGDKPRVGTLRLIKAAIQSAEIDAKKTIDDAGVVSVMTKMVKQRRDSIEQYTKGGRPDLAAGEQSEIAIIEAYLPQPMSDADVAAAIKSAIAETAAASPKDMGKGHGRPKGKVRRANGLPEGECRRQGGARVGRRCEVSGTKGVDSGSPLLTDTPVRRRRWRESPIDSRLVMLASERPHVVCASVQIFWMISARG